MVTFGRLGMTFGLVGRASIGVLVVDLTHTNKEMGKKRGNKQSVVPHKEAFVRMNYLFQASLAVLLTNPAHPELSRFYIHTMRSVSKRLVLRMDPNLKRMLCKSCDTLLVPGVTSTHRLRAHREKHVVVKCLTCGTVKRFLARTNHQLWSADLSNVEVPPISDGAPHTTTEVPRTTEVPLISDGAPHTTTQVPLPIATNSSTTTAVPPTTTIAPSNTTVHHDNKIEN